MTKRFIATGTEKWLRFAESRLAALSHVRRKLGIPKLTKAYVPNSGVLVWVSSSVYGDWIRITGGGGYRAQYHSGASDACIRVDAAGGLVDQKAYRYADWSGDYATFAYTSTNDVVLDRSGTTVTVASSSAPSRRPGTTYWLPHTATMSHNGKIAVVVPKAGVATPTVSKLATIAKWTDPVGSAPGSWSTVDLPVPPAVLAASGWSGSATSTTASQGLSQFSSSDSTGPVYIGSAPTAATSGYSPMDGFARVHVNPYDLSKVYVTTQYWTVAAECVAVDPYTPALPSYPGGVVRATHTPTQQVWSYEVATGTWTLEYTHDSGVNPHVVFQYIRGFDGASWGSVDTYTSHSNYTAMTVEFSPQEGMHVVHFDNRVLPETTTTYGITGAAGAHFYDAVCYDLCSRSATADVYMGDEVLLPGYAVSTSTFDGFRMPEDSFVVLQLAKLTTGPRGALVQTAGYGGGVGSAVEWRHGDATTAHVTLPAQGAGVPPLFNKTMSRATGVDTGTATIRQKIYEDGAEIYDGINDMPAADPNVVVTFFDVQWLSWQSADTMYTFVSRDVTTPAIPPSGGSVPITFYTGTASSATLGFSFTVNSDPANDDGFDAAGTILYQTVSTSGTSNPVTAADLNTAFGVSDWTFTLDGGSYVVYVSDPGTPASTDSFDYHEIGRVSATGPTYSVTKTLTPTFFIDALAADIAFNAGATQDLIPDESVV